MAKLQAYALQDSGLDTVEANERLGFKADQREFLMPVEILKALDIKRVRLLSNNPDKVAALENAGIQVTERVPCEVAPTEHTEEYLKTKQEKLGHLFTPAAARPALERSNRRSSLPQFFHREAAQRGFRQRHIDLARSGMILQHCQVFRHRLRVSTNQRAAERVRRTEARVVRQGLPDDGQALAARILAA